MTVAGVAQRETRHWCFVLCAETDALMRAVWSDGGCWRSTLGSLCPAAGRHALTGSAVPSRCDPEAAQRPSHRSW